MGLANANDVMHQKRAKDFSRVENWTPNETVDFHLLVEALGRCHTRWRGTDEKARIERMCISLSYIETFNSKVIKGFVPELRSHYVFFEFRDFYVLSLWTFDVRFTHSYIMALVQTDCFVVSQLFSVAEDFKLELKLA